VLLEILDELAVSSRSRRNPRAIKRKMSSWPVRKRGTDGTGKVTLRIEILLTPHPMAKRKPRTKKTVKELGANRPPVDALTAYPRKRWDARGACRETEQA